MTLFEHVQHARLDLAASLDATPPDQRDAVVQAAVIVFGGSFVPAATDSNWGPHFAELSLLGISHMGADSAECIANWTKAVIRTARADIEPFPQPRNHAEEIANARAACTKGTAQ